MLAYVHKTIYRRKVRPIEPAIIAIIIVHDFVNYYFSILLTILSSKYDRSTHRNTPSMLTYRFF